MHLYSTYFWVLRAIDIHLNFWLIRVHENVRMRINQMGHNVRLIEILHVNQAIINIILSEQ